MATSEQVLKEAFGVPIPGNSTTIAVTGTTATAALTADAMYVCSSDVAFHINVDDTATSATVSHLYIPAGTLFWFSTDQSRNDVSVIKHTGAEDGTVFVQQMTQRKAG